jgi:hypothetical protein
VLIVDEVLAVGTRSSSECLDKIEEVADLGLAILLVSHDLAVRSRCDVVHLFEAGRLVASGTPQDIVDTYVASVIAEGPQILSVRGWRLNGGAVAPLAPGGRCVIEVDVDVASAVERATVTLHIERAAVALWEGSLEADIDAGGHCVRFELAELPLSEGSYELSISIEGVEGLRSTVPIDPGLEVGLAPRAGRSCGAQGVDHPLSVGYHSRSRLRARRTSAKAREPHGPCGRRFESAPVSSLATRAHDPQPPGRAADAADVRRDQVPVHPRHHGSATACR